MTYVNSQANVARGVTVTIDGVPITEITDDGIPQPQTSVDDIEVTNQNSGDWKEYKAGRKDGGECELKANAVDSDLGQAALATAAASGATCLFITTFPSGSTQSFYGVVKTYDHVVENQILMISCKIKVSGAPTFSGTKSALNALAVTGEVMVPAPFAATTYTYTTVIAAADTQAVIVPTKEGAAITVDGSTVASGGNGTITIGDAGTDVIKDVKIVVKEPSKAATVYTVIITRPKA
jgi:hypothetical protein